MNETGRRMISFGSFEQSWSVTDRPDLVGKPVSDGIAALDGHHEQVRVVDTDPELADTAALCATYNVPPEVSANCVIVTGKRGGEQRHAACVVLATTRVDVNHTVRKALDVRKVSFAPMEFAVTETGMEYGGIAPIGLPPDWSLLLDSAVTKAAQVLVGSGRRCGKVILPGALLAELPNATVVEGLGIPID